MKPLALILAVLVAMPALAQSGPGFDCARASSEVELAISIEVRGDERQHDVLDEALLDAPQPGGLWNREHETRHLVIFDAHAPQDGRQLEFWHGSLVHALWEKQGHGRTGCSASGVPPELGGRTGENSPGTGSWRAINRMSKVHGV